MNATESTSTIGSKRLGILTSSLARKEAAFDRKIEAHFEDVKGANGQPLNDKRNGAQTLRRWEGQDNALRTLKDGIEKTKRAIERERDKILNVAGADVPPELKRMADSGELQQWRRYPHIFFVKGVKGGRIMWKADVGKLFASHVAAIPKEQYPMFREAFYKAKTLITDGATR